MKLKTTIIANILTLLFINTSWAQSNGPDKNWLVAANSATTQLNNPPKKTPSRYVPKKSGTLAPLQGPITIRKSTLNKSAFKKVIKNPIRKRERDKLDQAWGIYRVTLDRLEYAYKTHMKKGDECKLKSYSINDQQKAGCKGSDTLNSCQRKLIAWCTSESQGNLISKYTDMLGKRKKFKEEIKKVSVSWEDVSGLRSWW